MNKKFIIIIAMGFIGSCFLRAVEEAPLIDPQQLLWDSLMTNNVMGAKQALTLGAKVNMKDDQEYTPLHKAVFLEDEGLMSALLEAGADINQLDCQGDTPLHRACGYDNPHVVTFLLHNGADISIRNAQGETPFQDMISSGVLLFMQNHLKEFMRFALGTYTLEAIQKDLLIKSDGSQKVLSIEAQARLQEMCDELNSEVETKPARAIALARQ